MYIMHDEHTTQDEEDYYEVKSIDGILTLLTQEGVNINQTVYPTVQKVHVITFAVTWSLVHVMITNMAISASMLIRCTAYVNTASL